MVSQRNQNLLKKNIELCNVSFCGNIHLRKCLDLHKKIAHSQDTKIKKLRDFVECQFAISENLLNTCKSKYTALYHFRVVRFRVIVSE